MESHGGAINVYSEVDLGTEFQVFLPLSANSEGEIPGESVQEKIKGTGRIYLIDDEEVILITGSALLRESGYDVETFINPLEAIESFRANPAAVDLIITDMVMPECSGIDLFYSMKEIDSNCRVVISSGFSQNENLNRLRKDGLCGYIGKPFSDVELSRLVSEVLE